MLKEGFSGRGTDQHPRPDQIQPPSGGPGDSSNVRSPGGFFGDRRKEQDRENRGPAEKGAAAGELIKKYSYEYGAMLIPDQKPQKK